MDASVYQQELQKLEREISDIENPTPNISVSVSGFKKNFIYLYIIIGVFVSLILLKPKIVLEVDKQKNIIVNKKKFIIWFIILSIILSGMYTIFITIKKN